jgi:hypothetical protein
VISQYSVLLTSASENLLVVSGAAMNSATPVGKNGRTRRQPANAYYGTYVISSELEDDCICLLGWRRML